MPGFKKWEVVLWDDDHGDPKCGYKIIDSDGKYVLGGYDSKVLENITKEHNTYPVLLEALREATRFIGPIYQETQTAESLKVFRNCKSALSIAGEGA